MSGGKSFQPWLPYGINFNSNLIIVHNELVREYKSDSDVWEEVLFKMWFSFLRKQKGSCREPKKKGRNAEWSEMRAVTGGECDWATDKIEHMKRQSCRQQEKRLTNHYFQTRSTTCLLLLKVQSPTLHHLQPLFQAHLLSSFSSFLAPYSSAYSSWLFSFFRQSPFPSITFKLSTSASLSLTPSQNVVLWCHKHTSDVLSHPLLAAFCHWNLFYHFILHLSLHPSPSFLSLPLFFAN